MRGQDALAPRENARSEGVPPSIEQSEYAFHQDFGKLFHDWAAAKFPIQSMM